MTPRHPHTRRRRRGIAAMLAMLFLVLFGILALGFYSTVTTSQQVAASEQRSVQALAAAESGMELLRYYLALVRVRGDATGSAMMTELFNDLGPLMDGSPNLGGVAISKSGDTIFIPGGGTASVSLGSTTRFRAKISLSPDASGRQIFVDVTGAHGNDEIRRTIRFAYDQSDHISPAFTFALATHGGMTVKSGGVTAPGDPTLADVLSTSPASPAITISGGSVGGDLAVTGAKSQISYLSGSVHGSSNPTTIASSYSFVVPKPPLPVVDTTPFKAFATNTYGSGGGSSSTHRNIRIPANTNPKFTGSSVIEGILYIESPNKVEIQGNCTVKGLIVFENAGNDTVNSILFKSGKLQQDFPPGAEFDAMRKLTGIGLLAPTATVTMAGSSTATLLGSVIVSKFTYIGSANITIDKGTVVALSPASDAMLLNGTTVTFNGIGAMSPPSTVVRGEQSYLPVPDSYVEVPQ